MLTGENNLNRTPTTKQEQDHIIEFCKKKGHEIEIFHG